MNTRVLCNYETSFWLDGGDSGSPVFLWWWFYGVDTVELVGLLWGSDDTNHIAFVSPWPNVELDLGTLDEVFKPRFQAITTSGARDVGVGANGAVWIVSDVSAGNGNYEVKKLVTPTLVGLEAWSASYAPATRIAVDPSGFPWIVNAAGYIYRWLGSSWQLMPGGASDIGIGANGTVWVIGTDGLTYRWNGSSWTYIPGSGVRIAVDPAGNAWVVNGSYQIYRYVSGAFQQIPGGATDIGVSPDGMVWITGTLGASDGYEIKWWTGASTGLPWVTVPGHATAITADRGGTPWVANAFQQLFRSF